MPACLHDFSSTVPGLYLITDFLTPDEETSLVAAADAIAWGACRSQKRRAHLHVPWCCERGRIVPRTPDADGTGGIAPLPAGAALLAQRVVSAGRTLVGSTPGGAGLDWEDYEAIAEASGVEMQVNEFHAEDALNPHIDNAIAYKDIVSAVSLLCDTTVTFTHGKTREAVDVRVPRRSLYFMTGPSRYRFLHGVKKGNIHGERRLSYTFRRMCYTPPLVVNSEKSSKQKRRHRRGAAAAQQKDPSRYAGVLPDTTAPAEVSPVVVAA